MSKLMTCVPSAPPANGKRMYFTTLVWSPNIIYPVSLDKRLVSSSVYPAIKLEDWSITGMDSLSQKFVAEIFVEFGTFDKRLPKVSIVHPNGISFLRTSLYNKAPPEVLYGFPFPSGNSNCTNQ